MSQVIAFLFFFVLLVSLEKILLQIIGAFAK